MRWRAVVVALAMVTAGCGAFGGTQTPRETVTPAPVPTVQSETPSEPEVAPGVGARGSLDAARLAAAHRRTVTDRAYTWRERVSVTDADGARRLFVRSRLDVESERRFRYRSSTSTEFWEVSEFADGTTRHRRSAVDGGLRLDEPPLRNASYLFGSLAANAIAEYLVTDRVDVAATTRDGQRAYLLSAESATVEGTDHVRNVSIRGVVTRAGFVRSLRVRYDEGTGEQRQHVRYRMRYAAVGNTTVERPDWAPPASG